jgi:ATP-dependent Lon protease
LKEKVLGAVRAGITRIVIPKDNEADLEDLTEEIRDKIEVKPVESLAEALAATLRDTSLKEGRLFFGTGPKPETGRQTSH